MNWQNALQALRLASGERVLVLEAEPGPERGAALAHWLENARRGQSLSIQWLDCELERGGVWAGVDELLEALVPRPQAQAPALLGKHGTELAASTRA